MAFVITPGCCNDASCVDVCPVDCIRPHPDDSAFRTAEQLYIDPSSCIDCSACMYACPVSAIHDGLELPPHLSDFATVNRDYFLEHPLTARFLKEPPRSSHPPLAARVAVIGSGPSGCYAVAELSAIPGIEITVFDQLPTPFGLVRSGVAPDHPATKLVADYFQRVLQSPTVRCFLNVQVGVHVTLQELLASHHAVIYAGGASQDKRLGISGEDLPGSHSAREFVAWYNGHPDFANRAFDLSGRTAVVLGNGNVALDVARVLTRGSDDLAATDMADHAVEALRQSNICEVVVAARRGPEDAACTFPELWELTRLPGVQVRTITSEVEMEPSRPLSLTERRKRDLFRSLTDDGPIREPDTRRITFRFGVQPAELNGIRAVEAVRLLRTTADRPGSERLETGLVLRAIGYRIAPVPGLPYDSSTGTLANVDGRLVHEGSDVLPGLYCVGWAKRGASGVIGTNKSCSQETVQALVTDLTNDRLAAPSLSATDLAQLIRSRQPRVVDLAGWQAIDSHEQAGGRSAHPARPRRKMVQVEAMLDTAGSR